MNFSDVNLLEETIAVLAKHGRSFADVIWVGLKDGSEVGSWADFAALAAGVVYDAGYGLAEINLELVVVGDNWWLERSEYDGAEDWEYKTLPLPLTPSGSLRTIRRSFDD